MENDAVVDATEVDDLTELPDNTPRSSKKTALPPANTGNSKGKKRRIEALTEAVNELQNLNKTLSNPETSATDQEDESEIMGKQIASQLRQLPVAERLRANFEMQKILMDFRLRNLSSGTVSSASTGSLYSCPSSSRDRMFPSDVDSRNEYLNADIINAAMVSSELQYVEHESLVLPTNSM